MHADGPLAKRDSMASEQKKQVPLRLSSKLYSDLATWAEEDFRSLNGQIEYLLTSCVKAHKKESSHASAEEH